MAGEALAAMQTILTMQSILKDFQTAFHFEDYLCPIDASINTVASQYFDYIIVGAGTSGSVLANRLSACPEAKVLVLEAGGCPPIESELTGFLAFLPGSAYDYNFTSVNDHRTCQNLQGRVASMTQGKMLGGSSGFCHTSMTRNSPSDYDNWAKITNDSSWSYECLLQYLKNSEDVKDKAVLNKYREYHGNSGPTIMVKQLRTENNPVIKAHKEIGYKFLLDYNSGNDTEQGIFNPFLEIGNKKSKQNGLVSYISPIKDRPNLFFLTQATVFKIIFEGNVANGVKFAFKNENYEAYAKKEVIVSAGAIRTPQLLMLSGIGPAERLNSLGIPVKSNLPVGQNLQDHVSSIIPIALQKNSSATVAPNFFEFPSPITISSANLRNSSIFPLTQATNLIYPQNNDGLLQFCLNVLKFSISICQKVYEANINRTLLLLTPSLLHPQSRGEIRLNSTDINDQAIINLNYYTEGKDLDDTAAFMSYTASLVNTTSFRKVGAEIVDLGICTNYTKFGYDYWKCMAIQTSCTLWHYCGTASMGSVVDKNLLVKGVRKLRVVDASVFPTIPGGNPMTAVLGVAEKMADVILASNSCCARRIRKPKACRC